MFRRVAIMLRNEIPNIIEKLLNEELTVRQNLTKFEEANKEAFLKAWVNPSPITVNFSGGMRKICWNVTKSDGTYRVVFLPEQGYFALCVDSDLGPLDIGVHGSALGCFGSV